MSNFQQHINAGYTFEGPSITLGGAMIDGVTAPNHLVNIPLKTMNRHGLIAGATGTGKTKSLQVIAEQLSEQGVPSLLMDLKGDLSGLAAAGTNNKHIVKRHGAMDLPWAGKALPVELLSLSGETGAKMRATVTEFGPILLSKILELNDTQTGVMGVLFKYCDDQSIPLVDLKDLKKTMQYVIGEGKSTFTEAYGSVSPNSINAMVRKIVALEQQGAEQFFGEPSFDPQDLLRKDTNGNGFINIIRLTDIQDKPNMFSTFMLSLLAEIYATFPEQGDADRPKLCIFIDEAHLIFKEASDALLSQLESIIKLIRSKGVGIYFCTQVPSDVPDEILGQLGLKVQHALRAFTAKDRKAIKKAAENYPVSDFYKTDELLTQLGIGEALITGLNEKGIPTPLAATLMRAPLSRMDILTPQEIKVLTGNSALITKYNTSVDRESAYEILNQKIATAQSEAHQAEMKAQVEAGEKTSTRRRSRAKEESLFSSITKNTMVRQIGRTIAREAMRGLLGALGVKKRR